MGAGRRRGVSGHTRGWFVSAGADTVPGKAAAAYREQTKEDGWLLGPAQLRALHHHLETGGGRMIGDAGLRFIDDTLTGVRTAAAAPVAASGRAAERGRCAAVEVARRHESAALRDVARALTKHQGFMLAKIVEEIHAPDLAVELGVMGW